MQIQLMTNYLIKGEYQGATEVPDPFHGGPEGFEKVANLPCMSCHHAMPSSSCPPCSLVCFVYDEMSLKCDVLLLCATVQELAATDVTVL